MIKNKKEGLKTRDKMQFINFNYKLPIGSNTMCHSIYTEERQIINKWRNEENHRENISFNL